MLISIRPAFNSRQAELLHGYLDYLITGFTVGAVFLIVAFTREASR